MSTPLCFFTPCGEGDGWPGIFEGEVKSGNTEGKGLWEEGQHIQQLSGALPRERPSPLRCARRKGQRQGSGEEAVPPSQEQQLQ